MLTECLAFGSGCGCWEEMLCLALMSQVCWSSPDPRSLVVEEKFLLLKDIPKGSQGSGAMFFQFHGRWQAGRKLLTFCWIPSFDD